MHHSIHTPQRNPAMRLLVMGALALPALATLPSRSVEAAPAVDAIYSSPIKVAPDWSKVVRVSKTTIGIQDCPEPPLLRGHPLHDKIYQALRDFNGDYSRLQPWFPYPKLAVAELRPPEKDKTYWDFKLPDELLEDFMQATQGHPVVLQPGTVPAWMLSGPGATRYPEDPNAIDWTYAREGKVNEATARQFAEYQARLASWYIKGGFKDEVGRWHASHHAYKFAYWEPLNEEDERFTPEELTRLYDAAVEAVRPIDPAMKFMGPTLASALGHPEFFSYFLDPKNHRPGIPVDAISYHFYTLADSDESMQTHQYSIFQQAQGIVNVVRYIENLRKALRPTAITDINELGTVLNPAEQLPAPHPIPDSFWPLSGAVWAYLYGNLAALGIDIVGAAELIDYPGQFGATTLVHWDTGIPNTRYWVVRLLHEQFGPGNKIVAPQPVDDMSHLDPGVQLYAQGFITPRGEHKVLLVNKRDRTLTVDLPGAAGGEELRVDQSTTSMPVAHRLSTDTLRLPPSAVSIVNLAHSS